MKVLRNRLHDENGKPYLFKRSRNIGGDLNPSYLIVHYTAAASADSTIAHFLTSTAKASAHLVIARDGTIVQLVPFNRVAWHAGQSHWHGLSGLNRHSIGIELDNAGMLTQQGGKWTSWLGRAYPDEQVHTAHHKHDEVVLGWHTYTEAQLSAAVEAARAIMSRYALLDVLGHDDIAPNRKKDPGPAFPMDSFRASTLGRASDNPRRFVTRSRLNIRSGPGTSFDTLQEEPLPRDTELLLHSRECNWCFVEVLDDDEEPNQTGWVYGDYITPKDRKV